MPGHLNRRGEARMVDVGAKPVTRREAVARGSVRMSAGALRLLRAGRLPKGDAMAAARIAGILAAKRTGLLIPLCHPLPLDSAEVRLRPAGGRVDVEAVVCATARTGVEMEALVAVSAACLTLYDMAKSEDKRMTIGPIYLAEKRGGRSGDFRRGKAPSR
ncbi:MAG: cyclic pyranopterin monophosphate synthase MoaC [Elusimicrobiota bacterium]